MSKGVEQKIYMQNTHKIVCSFSFTSLPSVSLSHFGWLFMNTKRWLWK